MIRLALVDDDAMVRTGLRMMLGGEADLEIVGEAANGVEGERLVAEQRPDVVLLDIRMPVQDGLVTVEHLRRRPHPPAVIMLTTFDTDELVLRALGAGAAGFLLKDTRPDRLIAAIHAVAAGEPILSPTVALQVINAATGAAAGGAERAAAERELGELSPREREVAVEIARGRSNAEIGESLFMSVATVKATITRIFQKLGTDNRVQVAMKVRDAGALEDA